MSNLAPYWKAWIQGLGAVILALFALLSNGGTPVEWINFSIMAVGTLLVFTAANVPGARYTKAIVSGTLAALTLLTSLVSGGVSLIELGQIVVAFLTAAGVLAKANDLIVEYVPRHAAVADGNL